MKSVRIAALPTLVLATALVIVWFPFSLRGENAAAVDEVLRLKDSGVPEETMLVFVRSGNLNYDLSAERVIVLQEQGLPQSVLNAMLESGKAGGAPPPPVPMAPASAPAPMDQDAAYFHNDLSPYGNWVLSEENQWYWQPTVAAGHSDWRPYSDNGRWLYTDYGWYWSSDYPWGWAAFHYGRWNLHPRHGWVWYPEREWAPAWVTWRTGGDYLGWAPLPRFSRFDRAGGGLSFFGNHVSANFSFGLGWNQYNYTRIRDMGERGRSGPGREVVARRLFSQTTPLNNYGVSRSRPDDLNSTHIVNHGVDPARIAAVRGVEVRTVRIQDRLGPPTARMPDRVDSRSSTLEVYRPRYNEGVSPMRTAPTISTRPRTNPPKAQSPRPVESPVLRPQVGVPPPILTPKPMVAPAPHLAEPKRAPAPRTYPSPAGPAKGPWTISNVPRKTTATISPPPSAAPRPMQPAMVQPKATAPVPGKGAANLERLHKREQGNRP